MLRGFSVSNVFSRTAGRAPGTGNGQDIVAKRATRDVTPAQR